MAPGVCVHVHDAYVAGEGVLHAALFGLVTLANLRGTPELARGELARFFAETIWYPTALLPSQGVRWQAVDDITAKATLIDGDVSSTLLFEFADTGLVRRVRAEARERLVNGVAVPTPWECRATRYEVRAGMQVPVEAEVSWIWNDGWRPYWRGRITALEYEFAR
jgi:hypothetical protein